MLKESPIDRFATPHERRPGEKRILTRREALSIIEIDHMIPEAIDVFGSIRTERAQRVPIDDIESVKKSGVKRPEREIDAKAEPHYRWAMAIREKAMASGNLKWRQIVKTTRLLQNVAV